VARNGQKGMRCGRQNGLSDRTGSVFQSVHLQSRNDRQTFTLHGGSLKDMELKVEKYRRTRRAGVHAHASRLCAGYNMVAR